MNSIQEATFRDRFLGQSEELLDKRLERVDKLRDLVKHPDFKILFDELNYLEDIALLQIRNSYDKDDLTIRSNLAYYKGIGQLKSIFNNLEREKELIEEKLLRIKKTNREEEWATHQLLRS